MVRLSSHSGAQWHANLEVDLQVGDCFSVGHPATRWTNHWCQKYLRLNWVLTQLLEYWCVWWTCKLHLHHGYVVTWERSRDPEQGDMSLYSFGSFFTWKIVRCVQICLQAGNNGIFNPTNWHWIKQSWLMKPWHTYRWKKIRKKKTPAWPTLKAYNKRLFLFLWILCIMWLNRLRGNVWRVWALELWTWKIYRGGFKHLGRTEKEFILVLTIFDWISNSIPPWEAYWEFMSGRLMALYKQPGIHLAEVGETVNLTLSENHHVQPCAPAKDSAHAYTQNCARIHRESLEDAQAH